MTDEAIVSSIRDRLLADRRSLLDLSTRNRLIHVPLRTKNIRAIEIVDEKSSETFRLLSEGKSFTFLPGRALTDEEKAAFGPEAGEIGGIPQPDDDEPLDERGFAPRHTDTRLQTRMTSEGLQKRLFDIWYDARTLEEEQGVNILYLALGLLKWFEDDKSEIERQAPIVLLPVKLERTSAADRFKLQGRGEPPSPNLSLQAKMNAEFGLKIEDFGDEDDVDLNAYFEKVAQTVAAKKRWEVQPDAMVLGFFSFAKFLMYRDLDPDTWPNAASPDKHDVVSRLLQSGFDHHDPIVSDHGKIDPIIPPIAMNHVLDADSSQTVAIEEVARGRHLVIKGPPGTGKSQTITNIIASAAAQGKKVLFVAEKMAALDVVNRRLRDAGLGSLVLELHSNKVNKRVVLEELKRSKEQSIRQARGDTTVIQRLTDARDELNRHAERMHTTQLPSGITPFQLLGRLIKVREENGLSDYALGGPETWSPRDVEDRKNLLDEIVERIGTIGPPEQHAWKGVKRGAVDPSEMERLVQQLATVSQQLMICVRAASQFSACFDLPPVETVGDLAARLQTAKAAAELPNVDREALLHPVWNRPDTIKDVIDRGQEFSRLKTAVDQAFSPIAWDSSLADCRTILALKGKSLFRFLNGSYRSQLALLRSYVTIPLPKSLEQRLLLIDGLLAAQSARRNLDEVKQVGVSAFGQDWRGEASDWDAFAQITNWLALYRNETWPNDLLHRIASNPLSTEDREALETLQGTLPQFTASLDELFAFLELDLQHAFGMSDVGSLPLQDLVAKLAAWGRSPEAITKWIAFAERSRIARDMGLGRLIDGLTTGALSAAQLLATFRRSYYEALRTLFFAQMPELKRFDGEYHSKVVSSFRSLDTLRMALAREQIAQQHATGIPRSNAGIGPLGILNGEFAKKRNHLPLRKLLDLAGPVVQQIKPIFLMSPLSVAQFLKPGGIGFDLLVIDEASQIEPVDALGAIARCNQVVVVGDERQLPPTRFFAKLTSDIDERSEDDEATFQARDAESILDLCLAKGMSDRMLNWHYRSKHQSLIAVSNHQFYENRLFIVPSPYDAVAGMGLKFNYLPDAHYDRGKTRTNPREAKAVAEAVLRHAKTNPNQSLGVATFSVAQRQAILNELELLRRANPDTEEFFSRSAGEPFFVKSLENIQGDERDVIFISLGYGKTKEGYLSMSFGPLNSDGGERRLNVLISRAKLRCEVFSSITGDDIDLDRARGKGVAALKMFLSFAKTGKLGIAEATGREADSVFEEQVALALTNLGYDVKTQIGTAGFFVDIAIADPERPGRFILGIECDGAQYHSSRSARDRDRLRQNVLEAHGWFIHRIWSTDWFMRPKEELAKVEAAIEAAKAAWRELDDEITKPKSAVPLHFTTDSEPDADIIIGHVGSETEELSKPYVEAEPAIRTRLEPHELPLDKMAKLVSEIVSVEGPIHDSEIVVRVRSAWGLARAGNRIREAVQAGIDACVRTGAITGGPFHKQMGQQITVRDRSNVKSPSLRKPETLPPEEIEAAILSLLDANFGATKQQLIIATARAFGFSSTSSQLRTVIEKSISDLMSNGKLAEANGQITRELERSA